jgi:hypothetical protein
MSIEEAAAAALAAIELENQQQLERGMGGEFPPSPGEIERQRPSLQEASFSRSTSSKRWERLSRVGDEWRV